MNKSELIKRIAENCDFSLQKVKVVVNVFLETISSKIAEGDSVKLLNFGRWYVKERLSRNIRIGCISGYCNYRQDLRTFNIHRIKEAEYLIVVKIFIKSQITTSGICLKKAIQI